MYGTYKMDTVIISIDKNGFKLKVPYLCSNNNLIIISEYIRFSKFDKFSNAFVFDNKARSGKNVGAYTMKFRMIGI
jgi:hypothetical protein